MVPSSKEIGIKILQAEKEYHQHINEDSRILASRRKIYDQFISNAVNSLNEFKKEKILHAKKLLEQYHIVEKHKITAKLIKDFKGYVSSSQIRAICE